VGWGIGVEQIIGRIHAGARQRFALVLVWTLLD